jgi:diguanylate cyclase (GGDEF)-like protein
VVFEIERERLKELFEHTSDGVMVIDRALRIVAFNPAAERLTASTASGSVGVRVCSEVAVCQSAEGFDLCETACPGVAALERGEPHAVLDVNLPGRGGQVMPAACIPMKGADGAPLAMILIRDVSDRVELEERILAVERFDRVSGLYARTYFDDLYRREIKLAERQGRALAAVVTAISGDALEGPEADQAIRAVGEAIRASLRKVDLAGRHDYQTFASVLLDTDAAGAASLISRIESKVEAIRATGSFKEPFAVRHGIGTVGEDGYGGLLRAARQRVAQGTTREPGVTGRKGD